LFRSALSFAGSSEALNKVHCRVGSPQYGLFNTCYPYWRAGFNRSSQHSRFGGFDDGSKEEIDTGRHYPRWDVRPLRGAMNGKDLLFRAAHAATIKLLTGSGRSSCAPLARARGSVVEFVLTALSPHCGLDCAGQCYRFDRPFEQRNVAQRVHKFSTPRNERTLLLGW
jgi:hypothetical protein